jgi:hypothetical protein
VSLLIGMILCYREKESLGITVASIESTLDVILDQVDDPLPFFACFALHALTWDRCLSLRFLEHFLSKLDADCLSYEQRLWPTCRNDDGRSPDWVTTAEYILFFLEIDVDLTSIDSTKTLIYCWLRCAEYAVRYGELPSATVEEILTMLIKAKVEYIGVPVSSSTCSMEARQGGLWDEWCRALKRNGKDVEDVVHAEGHPWLLRDDWRWIWNTSYPTDTV